MAKRETMTLTLQITGVRETLNKLTELGPEANKQIRTESGKLARELAKTAKAAGTAAGDQAALVARTVSAGYDRVPVVKAGGSRLLGRHKAPAWGLVFASEFGMNVPSGWFAQPAYSKDWSNFQYHAHTGKEGAWFFPSVEKNADMIDKAWNKIADDILSRFGQGDVTTLAKDL